MMNKGRIPQKSYEDASNELRRGPWTLEEDNLLIHYITSHGEGRWNSLAKCSGLKRTGKSCRLRWLNYLKPDIKRGNLTLHEQLLILELHSKWGNRWSKIAQNLPGRTENEIKNYWRTRVQKQARQLKVDSNSKKFLEAIRMFWMPRLLEKIEQNSSSSLTTTSSPSSSSSMETQKIITAPSPVSTQVSLPSLQMVKNLERDFFSVKNSEKSKLFTPTAGAQDGCYHVDIPSYDMQELGSHQDVSFTGCHVAEFDWLGEELGCNFWKSAELLQFREQEEILCHRT
ncbi:hypothetical protein RD792_011461 [Penstemon davidsonii]|uniref:Uncharacterized protein n=1 Tax=Penstemon davidsonii TaxID=160366 RepID=A0ABR0D4N4_9LAMI|nr:hypothetical protein RD792_011461 [Penstemon davidsonii]